MAELEAEVRPADSVSQITAGTARSGREKLPPDRVLLRVLVETLRSLGGMMPLLIVKYDKGIQLLLSFADGVWLEGQGQFRKVCHIALENNSECPDL